MEESVIFEAADYFYVPCSVVDKYIDAPQDALRLILLLLRNKNVAYRKEDLTDILKMNGEELDAAFRYWENCGLLHKYGGRYKMERPKVSTSDIIKYTPQKIADKVNSDPSVAHLVKRTEQMLARQLTTEEASGVLSITDWIGLPPEVAALLIEYVSSLQTNKRTVRNMVRIASEWEEMGFDSFEKADRYIVDQRRKNESIYRISVMLGIKDRALTDKEKTCFAKWTETYSMSDGMIMEAYSRTINTTGKYSINYVDKIIESWHDAGIDEVEKIPEFQGQTGQKKSTKPYSESTVTSDEEDAQISESWKIIKQKKREKDGH